RRARGRAAETHLRRRDARRRNRRIRVAIRRSAATGRAVRLVSRLDRGRPVHRNRNRGDLMTKLERWYDLLATKVFDRLRDPLLLALRLFIGWQFFATGRGKLEHIDRIVAFFTNLGIPAPALNANVVAWLETIGGVLLFVGLA